MDFKTQRRAVSAVESFGKKHKLLYPVCILIKAVITVFCGVSRAVDMALSDDRGRFLGMDRRCSRREKAEKAKEKKIRRSEVKIRRRSEQRQKRGFFKRAVSAVVSAAFAFMTMPAGLEIVSFAAAGDHFNRAVESQLNLTTTYEQMEDPANPGFYIDDVTRPLYTTLNGFRAGVSDELAVTSNTGGWTKVSAGAFNNSPYLSAIDLTTVTEIGANAFAGASNLSVIVFDANTLTSASIVASAFSGLSDYTIYVLNASDTVAINGALNLCGLDAGQAVYINMPSITGPSLIGNIIECSNAIQSSADVRVLTYTIAGADSNIRRVYISFMTDNDAAFDGADITCNNIHYICPKPGTGGESDYTLAENGGRYTAIMPLTDINQIPGVSIRLYKNVANVSDIANTPVRTYGKNVEVLNANKGFVSAGNPYATLFVPNTGNQQPYLKFDDVPPPPSNGTSDYLKHYACIFTGNGNNSQYTPLNRTATGSIPNFPLPDFASGTYTPYFLEVFDPQGIVDITSLQGSTDVDNAIGSGNEEWKDCGNFSFRITKARVELDEVKDVKAVRNGDFGDTVTFTWTTDRKATGCYFYIYDEAGNVLETYKYENPEIANQPNPFERTENYADGKFEYRFNYGDKSDPDIDRGEVKTTDNILYYDIVPYEKQPWGGEFMGEKYIGGGAGYTHPSVNIDHYLLRTVSNFSTVNNPNAEEPWIKLFWKAPDANNNPNPYQNVRDFVIKCYTADGAQVSLNGADVTVTPDANGEYVKTFVPRDGINTDTDYTFTVTARGTANSSDHYYTSQPAFAKAKNKPEHIGSPSGSDTAAARENIALTKGNTKFYVTWPEVPGGADAYRIDVYQVPYRMNSLSDLDTLIAGTPERFVHSAEYPVTSDGLYGSLTSDHLLTPTVVGGVNNYTVTIDRLNKLSDSYVVNGQPYMVVITALKYGIGMNFSSVQLSDPLQNPAEDVRNTASDYGYSNKYHYTIESKRVLCMEEVVPENILAIDPPHWYFDDKHVIQDRGIMLEWSAGSTDGVDGYRIERYITDVNTISVPVNAVWDTVKVVEGASTHSFVDTDYKTFYDNNIANNGRTRYWYRITPTQNKQDSKAVSAPVYFDLTPDVFKMTPPTPVWSQGSDGSIIIEWQRDPLNNADAYNIYDANGDLYVNVYIPDHTEEITDTDPGSTAQRESVDYFKFVDKNLDFDSLKRYTISSVYYAAAVNQGTYDPSSSRVLYESTRAPIAGVSGILQAPLNLEAESDTDGNIILTWTGVAAAEYYNVYYSVNGGKYTKVSVPPQYVVNANNLCYKRFNNLNKGDVYKFYVKSAKNISVNGSNPYNKEAESSATNELTMVVGVAIQPPTLKATAGDRQNTLEWSAVSGGDGYELYQCDANGTNLRLLTSSPDLTYTHTGLVNNQTYYYCVRSYRYIGGTPVYSSFSQVVSAKTDVLNGDGETDPRYLHAPIDFVVTTGDGAANLSWTAVDGAEGYRVYMITAAGDYQLLGITSRPSITYNGLTNGEIYTYTVTAYKTLADGEMVESTYAIPRSVTVGNYLAAPLDLTAAAGNRTVTLSWTAVAGATGYVVYAYSAVSGSFTAIGAVSQPGFVHENLENGLTYTYMVTAYKQVGLSNQYSNYSIAVSAVPSADINTPGNNNNNNNSNNNNNNNNSNNNGTQPKAINIVGTLPSGISHSELISAYTDDLTFDQDIDIRFSVDTESSKIIYDTLSGYAEGLDSFDVYPFDISTYIAGTNTKIQPASGHYLSITMPVPDSFRKYGQDIQVMHVKSDGQMEILPLTFGEANGVTLVQFNCAEFSPFAFVHYYTAEDMRSASGAAAAGGSGAASSSAYSMRFTCCGGFVLRKRNRIYKLIKK